MRNRTKKSKKGKCILLSLGIFLNMIFGAGCGQKTPLPAEEEITLIDPPAASLGYETVIRTDLMNASVLSATVCPEVRLYGLDVSAVFEAFDVYPGKEVSKGSRLAHADTEAVGEKIRKLQETMAEAQESYQEYFEENTPVYDDVVRQMKNYKEAMEELEEEKPEGWEKTLKSYEKEYTTLAQKELELGRAMKERKELYELDQAWQEKQLEYLNKDRRKLILSSGMKGVVADLASVKPGDRVQEGQSLVAVADTSVKELKCEYIPANEVMKAAEIYAVVNGKRYETEYLPISNAEYEKLKKQNGKVYSTFSFTESADEVEYGDTAVIVIVKERAADVLAVPTEAIKREGTVNYLYVLNGSKREYTVIKTGMESGRYTEIVSGLKEGDKVITDVPVTGSGSYIVGKGDIGLVTESGGTLSYPFAEWVKNPVTHGTVYLEEIVAQKNQNVRKGEVLARIRVEVDEEELAKKQRKLQREEERLADLREEKNVDEKSLAAKENSVALLREEIEAVESDRALKEIRSTVAGVISDTSKMTKGDVIANGASLFLISNEKRSCITIADTTNQLSFGQRVTVSYTDSEEGKISVDGSVISLNPVSGSKLTDKTAVIKVADEDMKKMKGSVTDASGRIKAVSYTVTMGIGQVRQVLLVPKSAVTFMEGQTYVKIRTKDGGVVYRSFLAGGSDTENYWVAEGLTEGMEICSE